MNFENLFIALAKSSRPKDWMIALCLCAPSISFAYYSPLTSFDAVAKSSVKKSGSFSFLFGCRLLPVVLTTDFSLPPFGIKARSVDFGTDQLNNQGST